MSAEKYANFRNEDTFPTFAQLPDENDIDPSFYEASGDCVYKPSRHWCFLAEIFDVEKFMRLRLIVRDKSGATASVAFHTDDRGSEFIYQAQSGFTVLVLYAQQHYFLDMTIGIRLEEDSICKIVPAPLSELLALSDTVGRYSAEQAGRRTCHGCDEEKADLQKCARCCMFWYCNKSCQTSAWNNKGHKRDCKLTRDNGLRALFLMNWDQFDGFVAFPLAEPATTSGSTAAAAARTATKAS